jgi:predicted amidohydrolase YtcJ
MKPPRASTVILGQVVVAALPNGLERADAVGITDGRILVAGTRQDVLDAAAPDARIIDVRDRAVIPGLHDFHLHLVNVARAHREVALADLPSSAALLSAVADAVAALPGGAWLLGRGWTEDLLPVAVAQRLDAIVGRHPAMLVSHDGHSLWASSAALELAGLSTTSPDPSGGRLERDTAGALTGVLRERAIGAVVAVARRLEGHTLAPALDEALGELAAFGITGATDAGDYDTSNGVGEWAELGDSFSNLAGAELHGRLRLTLDIPAGGVMAAAARGLRSGASLGEGLRVGWAKLHADGALGSRTAALFASYSCGPAGDTGMMRATPAELDALFARARGAGIGLAIHAIGDRAVTEVLDAFQRAPRRSAEPPDRIEHAQLVRAQDLERFAALDITASMQPVHCPSDRVSIESCWAGREAAAYPWGSLARAGARLAFGSDAPIEPPDPWLGMFAAVHRRYPGEAEDWHPAEAIDVVAALSAYTLGPARSFSRAEEGHLRAGAVADLAVLDVDLPTVLAADERLARVRSQLTMVAGHEVHRS